MPRAGFGLVIRLCTILAEQERERWTCITVGTQARTARRPTRGSKVRTLVLEHAVVMLRRLPTRRWQLPERSPWAVTSKETSDVGAALWSRSPIDISRRFRAPSEVLRTVRELPRMFLKELFFFLKNACASMGSSPFMVLVGARMFTRAGDADGSEMCSRNVPEARF